MMNWPWQINTNQSKLWLLWLMPWLFTGIGHDLMHSPDCPEENLLRWAAHPQPNHVAPFHSGLPAQSECLVDDWSVRTEGSPATPPRFVLIYGIVTLQTPLSLFAPAVLASRRLTNRGPPLP